MQNRWMPIALLASVFMLSSCTENPVIPGYEPCGNGNIDTFEDQTTEACDDGNIDDGDGCSATCTVEPGFICPEAGGPCQASSAEDPKCGNGKLDDGEKCDDGNTINNDGCSDTCTLEDNDTCNDGEDCQKPTCGDGVRVKGEACDDGNTSDGDGCSSTCTIEKGYDCPTPNEACIKLEYEPNPGPPTQCGDKKFEAGEICEIGFTGLPAAIEDRKCINLDGRCVYESIEGQNNCGNGVLDAGEDCDDGNKINKGDGCSDKCKLQPDICKLQNGSAGTVLLAADGDTLKVRVLKDDNCTSEPIVTIRMHGIDCPECAKDTTVSPVDSSYNQAKACNKDLSTDYSDKSKNEKGGYEAWEFVNELLASVDYQVIVGCETVSDTNPVCLADATLGRFLGYIGIEKDGQSLDLAAEIIRAGYGAAYTQFTSQRIATYCAAEKEAVAAQQGVWAYSDSFEQVIHDHFDFKDADAYLLAPDHCK